MFVYHRAESICLSTKYTHFLPSMAHGTIKTTVASTAIRPSRTSSSTRDIVLLQTTSVLDRFQAFLLDCRNTERTQCLA